MLRLYTDIIRLITRVAPYLDRIEKHDRDLARQGRRASASIALNAREGDGCRGAAGFQPEGTTFGLRFSG